MTEQNVKQQVATLIRETRKARGLTQKELGEKLGVAKNTVTEYERGEQNLTIDTLDKIFAALDKAVFIGLKE
ncbi:helix-turn-helix domain-containing protein [Fibrella forsythiae]|uniref:Helix-turn-helix transcriptional regulator n=1 Tax=Fibrella forsythiae TaxID=2817061 RepID=A0ABS3JUU7_9BACT|nr:helix-turn-helix transcriptional regulator [Fibrella forsythiae]MBO0953233.1 helix-turn-helix transcriptional regulator [Fibrella forsythiae]